MSAYKHIWTEIRSCTALYTRDIYSTSECRGNDSITLMTQVSYSSLVSLVRLEILHRNNVKKRMLSIDLEMWKLNVWGKKTISICRDRN